MIRFRCHRCKRPLAVPDKKFVGKKVKCPGCSIVTIVPDIPGADAAKASAKAKASDALTDADLEYVATPQEADDPLAALANATAETYDVAFDDPGESPRERGGRSDRRGRDDREERQERRPRRRSSRNAGPMMFFGALFFIAGVTLAAATHLRELEPALFFSLSGAGVLAGIVMFLVGVSKA